MHHIIAPTCLYFSQRSSKRIVQTLDHLSPFGIPLAGTKDGSVVVERAAAIVGVAVLRVDLLQRLLTARLLQLDQVPAVWIATLVQLLPERLQLRFVDGFLFKSLSGSRARLTCRC